MQGLGLHRSRRLVKGNVFLAYDRGFSTAAAADRTQYCLPCCKEVVWRHALQLLCIYALHYNMATPHWGNLSWISDDTRVKWSVNVFSLPIKGLLHLA